MVGLTGLAGLAARGSVIDMPRKSPEEAAEQVKLSLKKIGAAYKENDETNGFSYRYDTLWYSPYSFSVYVGSFQEGKTVVRVDSSANMEKAIADVIYQDAELGTFEKTYGGKSWLLGDTLTIISPFFGYLYGNIDSPFAARNYGFKSLLYLGIDAFLLWVGGKTFFTHGFDPFDRGLLWTGILMGSYRLVVLPGFHMGYVAQDRLVNLKYTFRF